MLDQNRRGQALIWDVCSSGGGAAASHFAFPSAKIADKCVLDFFFFFLLANRRINELLNTLMHPHFRGPVCDIRISEQICSPSEKSVSPHFTFSL